jgi:hypothetical protein
MDRPTSDNTPGFIGDRLKPYNAAFRAMPEPVKVNANIGNRS